MSVFDKESIRTTVQRCQRCGETHEDLLFEPLLNPVNDKKHWTMCPIVQQPILLSIVDE